MQFKFITFCFFSTWLAMILVGHGWLLEEASEGAEAAASQNWPSDSALPLMMDKYTLLFFAHPKCTCTRASLYELDRLMARYNDKIEGHLAFATDPEFGTVSAQDENPLWAHGNRIEGIRPFLDHNNAEIRRFQVRVSGTVLLFSPAGKLCFAGGITPFKGHCGISAGRQAIESVIASKATELIRTPVFGCSLVAPQPSRG